MDKARRVQKKCDELAGKWIAIAGAQNPLKVSVSVNLAASAFMLYALDWHGHDIADWKFPFDELESVQRNWSPIVANSVIANSFHGGDDSQENASAPWNVLFREALQVILIR